ncbi:hypothetical protein [Geotalea uraniireducens]|nr:hypothetical protein [Geotalea uraniireducens]
MKRKLGSIISILISLCSMFNVSACTNGNESQSAITKTEHTIISSHLEDQINLSNNLLYCASFQMAWNIMRDQIIKGDIILEPDTPLAKNLNRQLQRNNDISSGSYVAVAGELSKNLAARIEKELHEKFGEQVAHEFNIPQATSSARQLIAYAFLYKNLEFPTEFERLDDPIAFIANGREAHVKGFGIPSFSSSNRRHEKLSNQVSIFDYRNENDFILVLTSKSNDDQIIMAKVPPNKTLLQTYTTVLHRMGVNASELRENEPLRIPKVDFDITHSFTELENKRILNKGWEGWFIAKATHDIKFKLDEKGAVLKSRGFLNMMKEEVPPPSVEKPRKFVFDKPFLICLKQKNGDYPYFALWLSNPELFLKK